MGKSNWQPLPSVCRGIILRTMYHNGLHPPDYSVKWFAGTFNCGSRMKWCHLCSGIDGYREVIVELAADNFRFALNIPQENFLYHGQCDHCRTVFVAEATPCGETWEEFVARLNKESRRNGQR